MRDHKRSPSVPDLRWRRRTAEPDPQDPPLVKGVAPGTLGMLARVVLLAIAVAGMLAAIALGAAIEGGR